MRTVMALSLTLTAGGTCVCAGEPYYATGFEDGCDLRFWVAGGDLGTPTVELSDQDPASGAHCVVVDFTANAHVHYAYFRVPLALRWTPEMSLVIEAMTKVRAPEHVSVSVGLNRRLIFQGEDVSLPTSCAAGCSRTCMREGRWTSPTGGPSRSPWSRGTVGSWRSWIAAMSSTA